MRVLLLTCVAALLVLSVAHGKIYKWTDRSGKTHFADNIWAVPPAYRDQVEERASATPSPRRARKPPRTSASERFAGNAPAGKRYTVPLRRVGNAMFVDVVLNGALQTSLVVDTGAELTFISTAAARQLALRLDKAAEIPLRSASGTFFAPLTKVKSMTVGNATVHDVEVVVHDITPEGNSGLLGMSFLGNFQVTVNAAKRTMVLTTLADVPGAATYGGHPGDWWQRKFRYYRQQIAATQASLNAQPSARLTKTLRYFQAELAALERKATYAAVPRSLRY